MASSSTSTTAADGRLRIRRDGEVQKVVPQVGHLLFNGAYSTGSATKVLYITERAAFEMRGARLTVTGIAPGVAVAEDLKLMDARIFRAQPMLRRA